MAAFFGPIMAFFFLVIALLGAWHIGEATLILGALNPVRGVAFLHSHGGIGFVVLGSVFLGGDRRRKRFMPIWAISAARRSRPPGSASCWPALILNYLGQGAHIIADSKAGRESLLSAGADLGR